MSEALNEIKKFKENMLNEMLEKCTEGQIDKFNRMYPNGPSEEQMDWAIQQVENTLKKMEKNND